MFATSDKLYKSIFDAENSESPWKEASKKSGRPVNEASDCSGNMYDFFSHMKSKSED